MGWLIAGIIILALLCGLHQLVRCFQRGIRLYDRNKPSGTAPLYSPFQEMLQPESRHVIQVEEHRQVESDDGDPPDKT